MKKFMTVALFLGLAFSSVQMGFIDINGDNENINSSNAPISLNGDNEDIR